MVASVIQLFSEFGQEVVVSIPVLGCSILHMTFVYRFFKYYVYTDTIIGEGPEHWLVGSIRHFFFPWATWVDGILTDFTIFYWNGFQFFF